MVGNLVIIIYRKAIIKWIYKYCVIFLQILKKTEP